MIRDFLAPGTLAVSMATVLAVGQNVLDIKKGKPEVPASSAASPASSAGSEAPAGMPAAPSGSDATFAAFGSRVAFAESSTLILNRTIGGAYESGFLVTNPECKPQTVSFAVQLFDRHHERVHAGVTFERVERNRPDDSVVPTPDDPKRPNQWTMDSGESDQFKLTVKGDVTKAATLGGAVSAALLSQPMDYGSWSGQLPARGLLIMTRHSRAAAFEKKDADTDGVCKDTGAAPTRTARSVIVQPPLPPGLDAGVLVAALLVAVFVSILAAGFVRVMATTPTHANTPMTGVAFDFNKSWGSNVAVGAGVLTGLVTAATLPADQYSTSSTLYVVLAALFASFVPMGAVVYGLIRPKAAVDNPNWEGSVGGFLISTLIVLWGAIGQLLLLGLFIRELALARVLSSESATILIFLTKIVVVILGIYAIGAAKGTVAQATKYPRAQEPVPTGKTIPEAPAAAPAPRRAAMI